MATTINKLFPPVMDAYIPAISVNTVENSGLTIPFEVTGLNALTDIKDIHISITRQSNYQSLFKSSLYGLGIYVVGDLNKVQTAVKEGKIIIPSSVLTGSQLSFNEYYKVQIRFSTNTYTYTPQSGYSQKQLLSMYLQDETHLDYFSEWSTVSLIRFIAPPSFSLQGNIHGNTTVMTPGNTYQLDTSFLELAGTYKKEGSSTVLGKTLNNSEDKEYLSNWSLQITDSNDEVLFSSKENAINFRGDGIDQINYSVPYYFENNVNYKIVINITTANLYSTSFTYQVKPSYSEYNWGQQTLVNEFTNLDSVIGKVNISFEPAGTASVPTGSKFIIRRACENDDFTYWDVMWTKTLSSPLVSGSTSAAVLSYDDFTIESGTIYKYSISYIPVNSSTPYTIVVGPILSVFDHAFLTGEGTQLCVKFNPNVSGFKVNVADNTVTTIGGQYPYISRNGNMYYRSFSLSGTIAYEMDAENQFTSRSSIYGDWINVYGTYFVNRYINQQNDRITQRKFRELVMNYLYNDIPKLFRSTPEGNILVRLTDINLTPNQQLGRMIYDFSCTATEIGDCSVDNYKLYKIQDFGD